MEDGLSKTCNSLIDKRLEQLMNEVGHLEKNFGFVDEFKSEKDNLTVNKKNIVNFTKKVRHLIG